MPREKYRPAPHQPEGEWLALGDFLNAMFEQKGLDANKVADSAKKVDDITGGLLKGLTGKADVKNVMNVVSVGFNRDSV